MYVYITYICKYMNKYQVCARRPNALKLMNIAPILFCWQKSNDMITQNGHGLSICIYTLMHMHVPL